MPWFVMIDSLISYVILKTKAAPSSGLLTIKNLNAITITSFLPGEAFFYSLSTEYVA